MSKVETMDKRGIVGGHNMDAFEKFAGENNVLIVSKAEISKGIYNIQYRAPKLDRDLNFTGEHKSPKIKTVYDPKIYSDEDILSLGQAAAAKKYREKYTEGGQRVYSSEKDGISFRIYENEVKGMIENIHPE